MIRFRVRVYLKEGIADPQGAKVQEALNNLGHDAENVRIGKVIEFDSNASIPEVEKMCKEVLVNPVMEDFEIFFAEPVEDL